MKGLALCATIDDPYVVLKPGGQQRTCQGTCGRTIWVSPTTLAMPDVELMCNECGRAAVKAQKATDPTPIGLRIAPGALRDDTPADRRRRNELEAHGFRDTTPEEMQGHDSMTRPAHPDFADLSKIVNDMDTRSETPGFDLWTDLAPLVDPESVQYVARGRLGVLAQIVQGLAALGVTETTEALAMASWVEGFVAGAAFADHRRSSVVHHHAQIEGCFEGCPGWVVWP